MSTSTAARVAKGMRLALITGGLVAIAFGIAVLVWPGVGHALLGLLYVAGGVYAFIAIQSTTIVLAFSSP